jgi:hypothetical protein
LRLTKKRDVTKLRMHNNFAYHDPLECTVVVEKAFS